jgi:hypothetical protein
MTLRKLLQKLGLSARPKHVGGDGEQPDDRVDDKFSTSWGKDTASWIPSQQDRRP